MRTATLLIATMLTLTAASAANAQNRDRSIDLRRAQNTVDAIRLPDPPRVSTGTVVQPIARPPQQMPRGGSDIRRMRENPPPSPRG